MANDIEIPEITSEEAAELRHDEMMALLKKLVSSLSTKDKELYDILYKNIEAISLFSSSLKSFEMSQSKEIKIENNQDKVIKSISDMSKALNDGIERMIQCMSKEAPIVIEAKKEYAFSIIRDVNGNIQTITAKQK